MPPHIAIDYTFWEMRLLFRGRQILAKARAREIIIQAWQGERYARTKRLPPLKNELRPLRDEKRLKPLSPAQMRARIMEVAKASGAKIVTVPKGSIKGMLHHGNGDRSPSRAP